MVWLAPPHLESLATATVVSCVAGVQWCVSPLFTETNYQRVAPASQHGCCFAFPLLTSDSVSFSRASGMPPFAPPLTPWKLSPASFNISFRISFLGQAFSRLFQYHSVSPQIKLNFLVVVTTLLSESLSVLFHASQHFSVLLALGISFISDLLLDIPLIAICLSIVQY